MERGERPVGDKAAKQLSDYYRVPAEVIALSQGTIPEDVIEILRTHPAEMERLREKYRP